MRDHDAGMLVYTQLAAICQSRGQLLPRDRFLLIAGAEALRAGYPAVAERCRELIVDHNPAHLASRFASFAKAAVDADFQALLLRTERHCPFERAEHLLAGLGQNAAVPAAGNPGEFALALLGRTESPGQPLH